MLQRPAILTASLDITCPHCEHDFDIFDNEDYPEMMIAIFNNKWDDAEGQPVECPQCKKEFNIEDIQF